MFIKEKIMENLINKILNIYQKPLRKYGVKLKGKKAQIFSYSQHKSKAGRQYAKFTKIYFGKHKK